MTQRRLLIAANMRASRARDNLEPALAVLRDVSVPFELAQPGSADDLRQMVGVARNSVSGVVVAGGDGSIHAALPAMIESKLPLGILPLGTANDLAQTLGLPGDPAEAARIIADGHRRRIDVGWANGVPFINVASIGFAVNVTRNMAKERKRSLGRLSYGVAALEALGEAALFRADVVCDGKRLVVHACQIAVGNGVHYGGGLIVAEEAEIDDGMFDAYAIETASTTDLLALLPALSAGTLGDSPLVTTFRCRDLRVETEAPVEVSTDGEIATRTPVDFSVSRRALEVMAPLP